jgi:uncharacterized membrane protein YedE/YeeE
MTKSPDIKRRWQSRGLWLILFMFGTYGLGFWIRWTSQGEDMRIVSELLSSMARGSLIPLALYWFHPEHENRAFQLHQWFYVLPLLIGFVFAFDLALTPGEPLYELAARAVGFTLGAFIGSAILFTGRSEPPPPEIAARHNHQFRWIFVILITLILFFGSIAWYRLS